MNNKLMIPFLLIFLVPLGCAHSEEITAGTPNLEMVLATATTGTPQVEVPETEFDFGAVQDGSDYVHAFLIRNTGTEVLEIKKVLPG